jgi:glucan phosphorylase
MGWRGRYLLLQISAALAEGLCGVQETGKENLFIFGMDADDVPVWREGKRQEWKDYDPRFVKALELIKSGTFGEKEYFQVCLGLFGDFLK